jgi:hypothetical protein
MQLRDRQRVIMTAKCLGWTMLAVALVNGFWISQLLSPAGQAYANQPYQRLVEPALAVKEMLQHAPTAAQGSRLYAALALGMVLCLALCGAAQRRSMVALVAGAALLMTWASVAASVPRLGALQPNRFSAMAWLCLVPPAAEGVRCATCYAWSSQRWLRWPVLSTIAAFGLILGFYVRETFNEVFAESLPKYGVVRPEVKGERPFSRQLLDYLETRTDRSARVLFELSLGRTHDGGHMAGLYAWQADREFIGGPYPYLDFANAWDGRAFGKPLQHYTPAELASMLDAYNVGWIVCHSDTCRTATARLPGIIEDGSFGPVVAYRRASWPGFVAQGEAQIVSRCINRLELRTGSSQSVVLRYHWVPGLRAFPAAGVEPVQVVPGDRPFVRINNPPPNFVLGLGDTPPPTCGLRGAFAASQRP